VGRQKREKTGPNLRGGKREATEEIEFVSINCGGAPGVWKAIDSYLDPLPEDSENGYFLL
jgi:hypothetical protein